MITRLNRIGLQPVYDFCDSPDGCLISQNPKAYDSRRAIGFHQDKPSETAGMDEYNIYTNKTLTNYHAGAPYGSVPIVSEAGVVGDYGTMAAFPGVPNGCCVNGYRMVNNAQIEYYVDNSISQPFFEPVFDMPARATYSEYTDPMGSWKPCYNRAVDMPYDYSRLTFITDTSYQREDIMARQMAIRNRQRSEPFLNA